jgi:hypothetical protein
MSLGLILLSGADFLRDHLHRLKEIPKLAHRADAGCRLSGTSWGGRVRDVATDTFAIQS